MRIGFDISQTGDGKAGCGFYAEGLIRELVKVDRNNEYLLYPSFGDFYYDRTLRPRLPPGVASVKLGLHHASREQANAFWREPPENFETMLGEPDIVHANNYFAPMRLSRARLVYTLYDLSFLESHSWTTEENRSGCFKGLFEASLAADWIVAISQFSLQRFLEYFPHYPRDRTSIVYPGSRFQKTAVPRPPQFSALEPRKFWLYVSTIEPRKNHRTLLEAYAMFKRQSGSAFPLVLAGGAGWLMDDLQVQIRRLGLESDVIVPGYVDDAALNWLYGNAFCQIYVSLYEGFGMPVLESMSMGTPVIASNNTSIPEIIGTDGAAGLLVPAENAGEICKAMASLLERDDAIASLGTASEARAGTFSWYRAAEALLAVYRKVLQMDKRSSVP